ncbi:sensor histidine kinase [Halobacillus karajensis]|uniref:Signal transduction histidine-protein kinase/phosphatase DegS n=1 Tax=Halobacillus karajensis TaxID=195088 RepID=A0A024P4I8_9BACI|nr:sensor histidine kinase [Halobacillus karajensis]CDQ19200.1 Signal transduction histidine-protein kinase/phosphatase DegS [Halobacillus karajensis]CDQ22726.1 Signal transduction histidine-protein kinase/phosphatase DegS [Halobacillus karajensis]CDQ26208.1 Signal transduction histidine-protein kinase/phosphatase DegS [Halobacillus karajensis]
MSVQKTGDIALDQIINEMVETVTNSKDEIFQIGEESRNEFEKLNKELTETKKQVLSLIDEGDKLDRKVRFSRMRLSEVSKQFQKYSEDEIRKVYEKTHELQMDLSMKREKEKQLRERRDDLEIRLRNLEETIGRAEALGGKISVVLNYLTEDFKHVSDALEDAKEKQEFGLQIIEAQEEERRRLSREIHDGPAQMLANVMLRSDLVDRTYRERGVEEAMQEVKSVRALVRSALYEVRRIIYDLRPMALDDLGLVPTLKKYLATIEDYNKAITISFASFGKERRLETKYEVALFRLVQEAVQNSVKHAKPTEIKVKVEMKPAAATIIVKDDGKGFDTSKKKEKSFGLVGMRERVDMLEGELNIDSSLGEGTIVTIHLPIN